MSESKKDPESKLEDEQLDDVSGGRIASTSGDADDRPTEEVAFYYNKIAFGYATTTDGREAENTPKLSGSDSEDAK